MRNWLIITLLLVSLNTVAGQSPTPADQARQAELRDKAFSLLADAAREMRGLRASENRVQAQSQLASLFWARDEKQARALFDNAAADCRNLLEQLGKEDDEENPYNGYRNYQGPLQVRQSLARTWAQRDGAAALRFVRATRPLVEPFQNYQGYYNQENPDMALEAFIAEQLARQNPKLALKTARESLAQGLNGQHASLLNQLKTVDRALANEFARLLVDKAQEPNVLRQGNALQVVSVLLQFAHESLKENPNNAALSENELRGLVESLVKTASAAQSKFNPNQYNQEFHNAQSLVNNLANWPDLEKYAPGRAAGLKQSLTAAQQTANQSNPWQEYYTYIQEKPVEESLVKIAEAPPEYRDNLYQQLSWRAVSQGSFEQARQILSENLKNPIQRAQMLHQIEQQIVNQAIGKGDITAARAAIAQLRTRYERAQMLLQLASQVASQEKKEETRRELLDAALAELPPRISSQLYLHLYFSVSAQYARLDSSRAFAILEPLIGQFNELCDGAEKVNGFLAQSYQKGELLPNSQLGNFAQQLANAYALLAQQDFDRAQTAVAKIQRPEARIMAALAIGQNILGATSNGMTITSLPVYGRNVIID